LPRWVFKVKLYALRWEFEKMTDQWVANLIKRFGGEV